MSRVFLLAVMLLSLAGWWTYPVEAQYGPPGWRPAGDGCNWTDGTAVTLASCAMTYTLPGNARVILAPSCDVQELLAASRDWATADGSVYLDAVTLYSDYLSSRITRERLKEQLAPRLAAESRWRQALSACTP